MGSRITLLTAAIFFIFSSGCRQNETTGGRAEEAGEKVSIRGMVEDGQGSLVVLEELGARELIPLDTVVCDESGAFEISISASSVAFYVLRFGSLGRVTLLMEPGESAYFSAVLDQSDSHEIKGSPGSELLQELSREHKKTLEALGEITRKNMEMVSTPGYSTLKPQLDRRYDSITSGFRDYSLRFIHSHSGSLSILVALYNMYGQQLPVFDPGKDFEAYKLVDSLLHPAYAGFEAVDLLHAQVKEAESFIHEAPAETAFQKGEIAPDFVSSRTDGTQMALSELRGEYVLLSFWAGWSRLSRDENPILRMAMERYGKYPFRILQVSLDDDRDVWTGAIREDGLVWDHVGDLRRWETPVANLYRIEKIPSNLLIDPSGRIVETDLFGETLLEKLDSIFSDYKE